MSPCRLLPFCLLLTAVSVRAQSFRDASSALASEPDPSLVVWGASLVDANQDGRMDLYHRSRLFLQNGLGTFSNVLESPRFERGGCPMTEPDCVDGSEVFGGVFGDADGDGFPDLYIEDFDPGSRFFRNRFGLRWDLANASSGIDMSQAQSQGASWGDFDGDGDLDLFVGEEFGHNRYFENLGGGVFRDSGQSGITNDRHSYGVAAADYDLDGDLDVFVAACFSGSPAKSVNSLFRNDGNGMFTDVAAAAGVDDDYAGWAVVWLDYDRDLWPDVFVANMPIGGANSRPGFNKLYRNRGDGTFEDVSESAGVAGDDQDFGFGGAVADFDNDGWEDLYLANGFGPHQLFRNQGDGTFLDVMSSTAVSPTSEAIAVAVGDVDGDGWVDLFSAARTGNRLFINQGGQAGHLSVRLRGGEGNVHGVGARVLAWMNGVPMQRFVTAGDGMTSQNFGYGVHFGLGGASRVDSVVVYWPDGDTSRLGSVEANRSLEVVQGTGINAAPTAPVLTGPDHLSEELDGVVSFTWQGSSDPESAPISYTLAILSVDDRSARGELVMRELTGSPVEVDLTGLPDGRFAWTVVADDGSWQRAAVSSFAFSRGTASGISDVPTEISLALYPNPLSGGEVTLQAPEAWRGRLIEVFDVLGRSVLGFSAAGGPQRLDIAGLGPGLYFFRVEGVSLPTPLLKVR